MCARPATSSAGPSASRRPARPEDPHGRFAQGPVVLVGDEFTITTDDIPRGPGAGLDDLHGAPRRRLAWRPHPHRRRQVTLRATSVSQTDVVTEVVEGGFISNNKGINLPGVAVSVPALSEKDREDLRWALRLRADVVALSFVRSASDIADVHAIMDEVGLGSAGFRSWPRSRKPQAVDNLEAIVVAFDGIMVARGVIGVELPLEQVPLVQKVAVEIARRNAKPVIVATQVLDSMIEASRPTRQRPRTVPTPCSTVPTRSCSRRDFDGEVADRVGADDGPDHREHRGPRAVSHRVDRDGGAHHRRSGDGRRRGDR